MLGVTWNSYCCPHLHGARKTTHCMQSVFFFHGQVKSTICPCELQESLHRGNSTPAGLLLKTHKTPHRCQGHTFKEGTFFAAFTAHPHDYTFWRLRAQFLQYTHQMAQPLQYNVLHRTQPLQYTQHKSAHICICLTQMAFPHAQVACLEWGSPSWSLWLTVWPGFGQSEHGDGASCED